MSNILCTTMVSSYKRPRLLLHALESLAECADSSQYQLIIQVFREDPSHEWVAEEIREKHTNAVVIIGTHVGYNAIGDYFTDMSEVAKGKWLHIFDDDMTMEGDWWSELKKAPDDHMVLCEYYTCGGSGYDAGSCDGSGIAWFIPNGCWKTLGETGIGMPPDAWMRDLLVDRNGWPIHHLKDIRLNHQWQRPLDGNR